MAHLYYYHIAGNIGGLFGGLSPTDTTKILGEFKFGGLAPTDHTKILGEFKFGSGVSGPFIKECCRLSLEALEQSHEFTMK